MIKRKSSDLIYSASARCLCGAGVAYVPSEPDNRYWDCADILLGIAVPKDQVGSKKHSDKLPFAFYEILSEKQPSANGTTTRPV